MSSSSTHVQYPLPNVRTLLYSSFILLIAVIIATMSTLTTRAQAIPYTLSRPSSILPHQSIRSCQTATTPSHKTLFSAATSPHTMSHSQAIAQIENTSLHILCLDIRKQIDGFLSEVIDDAILRRVQTRTRASLAVIEEALQRYS